MRFRHILLLSLAATITATWASTARGQACHRVISRTSLSELSGRPIRALRIVTLAPAPLPGLARALNRLHVRTREGTVRRQLLFAAGDTVDTLLVAESLRRLRRLRYFTDAIVEGVRCEGSSAVDLTVTTRDGWSTKPSLRLRSSSSSALSLTERNLFGTGREATVAIRSEAGRIGIGAAVHDPWLLGGGLALEAGASSYSDGSEWYASLRRREHSVFDRYGFAARVSRAVREPIRGVGDAVRRTSGSLLLSRRVAASSVAVVAMIGGIEYERAGLVAASDAAIVGPARVRREFAGMDVGVLRRSVAYDTLTWLLPRSALVDVPLAFETEALVGIGRERVTGRPALHIDWWAGKMWMPRRDALIVGDAWVSGYRTPERWQAATLRGSLAYYRAAARGVWTARLTAERLFDPDPDVRALASADPTLGALPRRARLAEAAVGGSLERSVHLCGLSRSWALQGAAFGAASRRWDPATGTPEQLYAGVVGLGLQVAPTKLGRATARLDVGFPLLRSAEMSRQPFLAISVSPWLEQGRQRDGWGSH